MTIAIMQPYFLPYIGYYQLIKAVDKFVMYDDVNFINRGWINRNNMLVGGKAHLFTIPLKDASQNKLINEVALADDAQWRKKLLKTIQQSYQKAPCFKGVFPIIENIVNYTTESISELALQGLVQVNTYLGITTEIIPSSTVYANSELKGQDRILDICQKENATRYINPIGGMELYDKRKFEGEGIELYFIKSLPHSYPQFKNDFVPWLSMLDVLMFNEVSTVHELLTAYELI
ncbi:WbqC family protein [Telluribacter humicola]|uniref:WbqC family protein n=1 Tax=Telluribacter humicola TaxID=1720261 RepID=UPI001A959380|nr:WbqC family protein [Telluribacter humicola]